ncbi:hypothetical protein BD309DRAFT_1034178 [Dichomitus squalens]|nr:hypothetical protein BD309DRAFT_1034178 [Dichomitus squalens]
MRSHLYLQALSLAGIVVITAATVASQTSDLPPEFEAVFAGQMIGAPYTNTTGPFGLRVHAPLFGGNLTDVTSGEVVATMLPTADDGLIIGSATLFSYWVLPYVWETDGKLASMTVRGVGNTTGHSYCYVHVETDSSAYSWMNSNFFIMKTVGTAEPLVHNITLYGVAN